MNRGESEFRASDIETLDGVITGTALKYGVNIPRGERLFERVEPGTFRGQLGAPNRIPILWQHDDAEPIGRASRLSDSSERLGFAAKISTSEDVPTARKALSLLADGFIDEVSVRFSWGSWTEVQDEKIGTIFVHTKARLREISLVTLGALSRDARVLTLASEGGSTGRPIDVEAIRAELARANA